MLLVWLLVLVTSMLFVSAAGITTEIQRYSGMEACSLGRVGHRDRAIENTTPLDHAGMWRMIRDSLRRRASLSIASIADQTTTAQNDRASFEGTTALSNLSTFADRIGQRPKGVRA